MDLDLILILILLLGIGAYYFLQFIINAERERDGRGRRRREFFPLEPRQPAQTRPVTYKQEDIHPLALEAMQRARQDPAALDIIPVDMGLLAYGTPDSNPIVSREAARLPQDARFVRPFVVLRKREGQLQYKVRFALLDGNGTQHFVEETPGVLKSGDTFLYSYTWLPLAKVGAIDGAWELHLYLNDVLLAAHDFTWHEGGGVILAHLSGDGEISDELLDIMADPELDRVSLDQLLGG